MFPGGSVQKLRNMQSLGTKKDPLVKIRDFSSLMCLLPLYSFTPSFPRPLYERLVGSVILYTVEDGVGEGGSVDTQSPPSRTLPPGLPLGEW